MKALISPPLGSIRDKLAEEWSLLELANRPQGLPAGCRTAAHFVEQGDLRPLRQDVDFLARSADGKIRLSSRGLIVDDICHTLPPKVSARTLYRFVQTGWTYQRKDGGPDQRFKNNPPVGYQKPIGYELSVNGKTQQWSTDPALYVSQVRAYSDILFEQIKTRAKQMDGERPTFHVGELLRPRPVACLKCGQLLIHGPTHFAEAVRS